MSPIDDELRAALHGRASVLSPAPDPLAGIERRARRIQRNRVTAAVAGSALAVAAIAVVVPAVSGATSGDARPPMVASAEPTLSPAPAVSYALDPTDPWAFRGTPVDEGSRATIQREYATLRSAGEVLVTPLFAQVYEASQQTEVVFLAEVDGAYRWGVAAATESGPEFLWDEPLPDGATSLAAALPGDEGVARLLVVASPEAERFFYGGPADEASMAVVADGVAVAPLEREPASDRYRVLAGGEEIAAADAPDPAAAQQPVEGEGPGTDEGPQVDASAYDFELDDPWAYRGPAELVRAPNLGVEERRLFVERHGEGWSDRPLYAAESDAGVSVLVVLHLKDGQEALVSTAWQVGDGPAGQSDQVVVDGQLLVQSSVPTATDGERLLVALASPQAGGIVYDGAGPARTEESGDPGVGLWPVQDGEQGDVLLYSEGDGLLYHQEPARTS